MRASFREYLSHVSSQSEAAAAIHGSLAALPEGRWLLAVSGGRDSMVLLDAMASARGHEIAAVATYDHGTGPAATAAAALVEQEALQRGLPVVSGSAARKALRRATRGGSRVGGSGGKRDGERGRRGSSERGGGDREAAWRAARWRFLNAWAEELQATVLTAHTWDDQIETVVLRLLRDAGARGLAGMLAVADPAAPRRPFLPITRAMLAEYADLRGVRWVEDPSNASLAFARNRVRHEILPALEAASPGFAEWVWQLSVRAAGWRAQLAQWVDAQVAPQRTDPHTLVVPMEPLQSLGPGEWEVLWPELAARVGVVMDRRGIERAADWAPRAQAGGEMPLSGGGRIARTARTWVVRQLY